MNLGVQLGRRLQGVADLLPARARLPLRVAGHRMLGGLEPEIALLPQLVDPDRLALDVGANMGVYTYALAPLAAHVHAFEPQPACCATIEAWAERRNVTVHQAAAGAAASELTLYIPVEAGRAISTRASFAPLDGPTVAIDVPVRPIDGFRLGPIGFIKIDVEGYEDDVIRGAEATLVRDRPVLLIEIDRKRHDRRSFEAIVARLATLGYNAHVREGDTFTPCPEPAWAADSHYNFIFRPGGGGR